MAKRKTPIDYTSRDFDSIKESLVDYAKRYYPEVYQDFNEASFGSLMLDMVSYVGDVMSFYVDYQANESFLSTAIEKKNVINLSRQMGYKYQHRRNGVYYFWMRVPQNCIFCKTVILSWASIRREAASRLPKIKNLSGDLRLVEIPCRFRKSFLCLLALFFQ